MSAHIDPKHVERIKLELQKAGMTNYGLLKGEARHLPSLIHKDEHIHGVVYGRAEHSSAMIVATDKRVLYLDHRVLFNKSDELTYDVVSGVSFNKQSGYAGIVLHTRLGDFSLRFVNLSCAKKFVDYVESRQIETKETPSQDVAMPHFDIDYGQSQVEYSQKAHIFLTTHETAVLSTIDPEGIVQGSVIYYAVDKNNYIYIVTKDQTAKARNIHYHPLVALTIFDTNSMQTLQIEGVASLEKDSAIKEGIYKTILRPRFTGKHAELPPIMHLSAGDYVVIVVKTLHYKYADYKTQTK